MSEAEPGRLRQSINCGATVREPSAVRTAFGDAEVSNAIPAASNQMIVNPETVAVVPHPFAA